MTRRRALIVVLALTLLMTTSACQQGRLAQNPPTPGGTSSQRNHVHDPSTLSVSVTFTASTTYDQAVTAFKAAGENLYPWNCDDPRTPTAPSVSQQRITFASSHMLFIFYPTFPELDTLAASPQVLSIDPYPLSMCP